MTVLDALFWVTCLVVVTAGVSKVAEPASTAATFRALGLPGGDRAARGLGAVEVLLGLGGLAVGGPAIALGVALSYGAFAVIVEVARRRELPSCGCFGASSAPPSSVHVAVNVVSAAVAAAAAVRGPLPVADVLSDLGSAPEAVVVVGLVLLTTAMVIVIDTGMADLYEQTRAVRAQADRPGRA